MRRVVVALLAIGGLALVLAGCSVPVPNMTFYADGHAVTVAPLQYCDTNEQDCPANGDAVAAIALRAGQPVQISAPDEVASGIWRVAARFKDANGTEFASCSPFFQPNQQFAYTLNLPSAGDQLIMVEVYQLSPNLYAGPNGGVEFAAKGTWAVTANGSTVLPKPGDYLCSSS